MKRQSLWHVLLGARSELADDDTSDTCAAKTQVHWINTLHRAKNAVTTHLALDVMHVLVVLGGLMPTNDSKESNTRFP